MSTRPICAAPLPEQWGSATCHARADLLTLTRARLLNWADWARAIAEPGYRLSPLWPPTPLDDADERDALHVERALLDLRARRRRWYYALEERYLRCRDDLSGSDAQHCSVEVYQRRATMGEGYIARVLTRREISA